MSMYGVRHQAVKAKVNPCRDAVGGHESGIHFHLLFRASIFGFLVPIRNINSAIKRAWTPGLCKAIQVLENLYH